MSKNSKPPPAPDQNDEFLKELPKRQIRKNWAFFWNFVNDKVI